MKQLPQIMRLPAWTRARYGGAYRIWMLLSLTLLGCCVGMLALALGAAPYDKLEGALMFRSYFANPLIPALNLLPPVLLIWTAYFLTRRAWAAFLLSYLPTVGIALVNFFKIQLRSDPFLAADLRLAAEAGGIVGGYTLDLNWMIWFALLCLPAGLIFALLLMPKAQMDRLDRAFGFLSCAALSAVALHALFLQPGIYDRTANEEHISPLSGVEVFISKGCVYPFLYSIRDMIPVPPEGYDQARAAALLAEYPDADIPEDQKVSIMGIMLEAFCDLTDFDALAEHPAVRQVYAPWHALEEQSISGDLLTNIFSAGTVDTEWGFVTGYTDHSEFRTDTDSYVWYLRNQGYQTFGSHPGFGWFYNRQNINRYLGFQEYWFSEDHYGQLVDPTGAIWDSDHILFRELLTQMEERTRQGPAFSFSVSYQNHGPYESTYDTGTAYLTPDVTGQNEEACHIWNNYLNGIASTLDALTELTSGLERMEEPVVLVLFGDHKPWGGNDKFAYSAMGTAFSLYTVEGFYQWYSTPYLIWANPAARAALGRDFVGKGGDFSPCFLMTEVFDQCGWEGPGFLQLSRQLRSITPLVHHQELDLYWKDGKVTSVLPEEDQAFLTDFLSAQYDREHSAVSPRS